LIRRVPWRWAAFPGLVFVAFLVLVGLNLNGSSISLLSPDRPGLVAGTPRSIRTDEWVLKTPVALSSVRQGLPAEPWIGMSPNDQAATPNGGPTHDWTTLLRPQDWGYVVLGQGRGLAVSWWWPYTICLIGCFALLGFVTRRPALSAALAVAATFTPYAAWWTAPTPTTYLGYGAATAACLLAAWSVRGRRPAAAYAVAAGLFAAAFALALYPPWQVTLAYVLAAVCFGYALDARIAWRRILWPVALGLGTALAILGAWYLQHRAAIHAEAATYYPGHRLSAAGDATFSSLIDGPLNFWMVGPAGTTLGKVGGAGPATNLSEASSTWLPLAVAAVVLLGVVQLIAEALRRRIVGRGTPAELTEPATHDDAPPPEQAPVWTLGLVSAAMLLLLAWAFLPLPTFVGKLTQLQRVEPVRVPLALGLGLILLVAAATRVPGPRPIAWRWPVLVLAAAATAAATVWTDDQLAWAASRTPTALVALSGLVLGAAFAAILHRRTAAAAGLVLALYAFAGWVPVNPLQRGIQPVTHDALVRQLVALTKATDNPRVGVYASLRNNFVVVAKVRASGLQSVTGTTFYPDADLMKVLVPAQEKRWNNYAQYRWIDAPAGTTPVITQDHGTAMALTVPVCDPVLLAKVDPGWIVADHPLRAGCISLVGRVSKSSGQAVWIYRVTT
jgi:hypothetical protein